ncbi:MAG: hypothetical protein GX616_03225 [Planctomycetes bacterium]|nr:hypothetical protein [Planctomycetota bacterium]
MRTICPHCKEAYEPDREALPQDFTVEKGQVLYRGIGCRECRQIGYRGRIGIYELLLMNDELRELVVQRASAGRIRHVGLNNGLKLLRLDGWDKVLAGHTTCEEVLRVTNVG